MFMIVFHILHKTTFFPDFLFLIFEMIFFIKFFVYSYLRLAMVFCTCCKIPVGYSLVIFSRAFILETTSFGSYQFHLCSVVFSEKIKINFFSVFLIVVSELHRKDSDERFLKTDVWFAEENMQTTNHEDKWYFWYLPTQDFK